MDAHSFTDNYVANDESTIDLSRLETEKRNPASEDIDKYSTQEILELINQEDKKVAVAIEAQLKQIARLTEFVIDAFSHRHRLFYIGAGTSGRLGVLDASECVPTFGVSPHMVTGLIAGGDKALRHSQEGVEDDPSQGAYDLKNAGVLPEDIVVGLAASGRTPYVLGALKAARELGCKTASIACTQNSEIGKLADVAIEVSTGPEILTGSTRMKAGTAQKMILNMISTTAMIRIGKAYKNLMVDVVPSNKKLKARALGILQEISGISKSEAQKLLAQTEGNVKLAVVMSLTRADMEEAQHALKQSKGHVRKAVELLYTCKYRSNAR